MSDFGKTLLTLRKKAGKSRYNLAQFSGLNEAYILRLETGERSNPSRDVVLMIALSLIQTSNQLEFWDIENLLLAANYTPLRRRKSNSL